VLLLALFRVSGADFRPKSILSTKQSARDVIVASVKGYSVKNKNKCGEMNSNPRKCGVYIKVFVYLCYLCPHHNLSAGANEQPAGSKWSELQYHSQS
jgi:hypothetical protein